MSRRSRIALDEARSSGFKKSCPITPHFSLTDTLIYASQKTFRSIQILPPHHPNTMASALRSIKSLAPLLDRVLVQRVKADVKTAGGIFLPESAQKELNQANVLAVGPGAMDKKGNRLPMGVATGDKVLIPQYGGSPIKVGEEEYSLFRDSEILAKINE
ncbi:mitochondrial heat shock protein Hsp10 [Friedmanniomyces endolithicus]|uniref:Mitochondrial heat shock protein Hsp10 n=3 Tax=Dothideomycetidae TaxID=451867 RepID=A0AAN6KID7_9PEZI|nr:mitochondrial heat shock protein Hsp10 [Friedmanniomyces endolithicus]KAK0930638.1 mitochondrial heat shock protein Hsp10 [Friedmanniomyces endolithicus]KAK0983963.1 mitochondrial heat shock protein Hsp10 [Friedmanniomyces endolithicus]KAK1008839.1 mitochondrial heat shock protein Hsp10 [Friedmanniomyces endolithicus]KAK1048533.1 mitochondrial heat shock protein Hsp10 [Friedmanniomyces endolithicus]